MLWVFPAFAYEAHFQHILAEARNGDAEAQSILGFMYDTGKGVPQDYAEAVKWYRKAAHQGFAEAQYNLGLMYYLGHGVPQDYKMAVKWYTKAAEQGDAIAQFELGLVYELGPVEYTNHRNPEKLHYIECGILLEKK